MDAPIDWWRAYSKTRPSRTHRPQITLAHAALARAFEHYRTRCLKSGALNGVARAVERAVKNLASWGYLGFETGDNLRALTLPQPIPISAESLCLVLAALEIAREEGCEFEYFAQLLAVAETA